MEKVYKMNKDATTQAIDVVKENLPEWFEENLWYVIQVCIDNEGWSKRLVEVEKDNLLFTNDIVHDVRGLINKDEHFLPRI
tara:strand:- start:237 stop:479 length:243 start_codon:yes stop_codon:yes gene_type:complete